MRSVAAPSVGALPGDRSAESPGDAVVGEDDPQAQAERPDDTGALPEAIRDLVAGFRHLRRVEHAASTGGTLSRAGW